MYCVEWNTLNASPARKSREERRPAEVGGWLDGRGGREGGKGRRVRMGPCEKGCGHTWQRFPYVLSQHITYSANNYISYGMHSISYGR